MATRNQAYTSNFYASNPWAGKEDIKAGIFGGESGGDYGALFGYSNRDGGRFSHIDATKMPLRDVIEFTRPDGEYGQWVKEQIGRVATPVGAFQGVGTTIRDWANSTGADLDRPFDVGMQDEFGRWVLDNQGTGAWEGYQGPRDPGSLLDMAQNNPQSPFLSTSGSIIDGETPEPEPEPSQFHPGMALSSLGAAMAASAEGRSAADDLQSIRDKYFGRRDKFAEDQRAEQQRRATSTLFEGHPDLEEFIAQGGDAQVATQILAQRNAQAHEMGMQEQQQSWLSGENLADRNVRLGIADADREVDYARLEREDQRLAMSMDQFAQTHGLATQEFQQGVQERTRDYLLRREQFDTTTAEGLRRYNLERERFEQDIAEFAKTHDLDQTRVMAAIEDADLDRELRDDQFNETLGFDRDQLAQQRELAEMGYDIDRDTLNQRIDYNNAEIARWGVQDKREERRMVEDNRRWEAQHALDKAEYQSTVDYQQQRLLEEQRQFDTEYDEQQARHDAQGLAGQQFLADTYTRLGMEDAAERVMQSDPDAFADPEMLNSLEDIMSMPYASKDQRSTAMKNWDYYQQMKSQAETPEELAAAEQFYRSLDKSVTVNNNGPKVDFEWAKADIAALGADREGINTAAQAVDALNQMQLILAENPDLQTGKLWSVLQAPLDILSSAGLLPEGIKEGQDARYMLDQLNTKLATLIKTPGAISNYEQQSFKAANPGVATPTQEIAGAIDALKTNVQRSRDRVAYIEQQTRGQGRSYSEAEAEWNRMMESGDPRTSPRYLNLDTFTKDNAAAFDTRIGNVVWVEGEPMVIENEAQLARIRDYISSEME